MAAFSASYEQPVTLEHRGLTVCKAGPWSQGPVLLQPLALLDGFDLARDGPPGGEYVHTVVECAKLAFADREAWYGDPAFADVPLETLLSRAYAAERRALVGEEASFDLRPGVAGRARAACCRASRPSRSRGRRVRRRRADAVPRGRPAARRHVPRRRRRPLRQPGLGDAERRLAALLARDPRARASASARARRCSGSTGRAAELARARQAAAHDADARRSALRDGEGVLAWGTPGGDEQDQWSLQFLLSHLRFGLNLQEAIDAPAFTSTHFPSSFYPRAAEPGHLVDRGAGRRRA